jgi:hypothetical protein
MDEAEALARADLLWRSGRRDAALQSLRARVQRLPDESGPRAALVARYRELGAPDQAGRFGAVVPGLTTPHERELAARQFAASGAPVASLPDHLALPARALTDDLLGLLVSVEHHRRSIRERTVATPSQERDSRREDAAIGFAVASAVLFLIGVVVIWAGALLDAPVTQIARWASVGSLVLFAIACGIQAWRRAAARRAAAASRWSVAAVLLSLGVVRLVALGLSHGGAIVFTWEG